jgi:hypothetical protein
VPTIPPIRFALIAAMVATATPSASSETKDLYFAEARYHAHQEHWFEALQRLDGEIAQHYRVDERELDSLRYYIDDAEFSVGDFELHYRMHHRAGRAIKAVLEGNVPEPIRNEAAYRLAKIHFHKGQPRDALHVLEQISGETPKTIADDIEFLRANIYLATGRPAEAVEVLAEIQGSNELRGFAGYNLGIALLRAGQVEKAIHQLDKVGRLRGSDRATLAIRDKSNLVLGSLALGSAEFDLAQRSLDRVRLSGPFSNKALLRAGRADASADRFERALVPWGILAQRESSDAAVQEVLLARPYAYGKLEIHGRAALLYKEAVATFGNELVKVDASLDNIRRGEFLKALAREEILQDKDWVVRLRSLPDAPETFYLVGLMASHDFQTGLQNYLDLEDLRKRLISWERSLSSFKDVIRYRKTYYEPLLPEIDRQFRKLDAQMRLRLEQREHLERRLAQILVVPQPDHLVTAQEHQMMARLDRLQNRVGQAPGADVAALQSRVDLLKGVLSWNMQMEYHERLTETHRNLHELTLDVDALTARYDAFVRTRQAATHSYVGYDEQLVQLRGRVAASSEKVEALMKEQSAALEKVAIAELERRRTRLLAYQNQARFATADSYDRAAKAQAR